MLYLLHIINQKPQVVFNGVVISNIIAIALIMAETTTIQITKQTRDSYGKSELWETIITGSSMT